MMKSMITFPISR